MRATPVTLFEIATTPNALADAELRQADAHTRAFYRRVYELMDLTGCSLTLAVQAVHANDERPTTEVAHEMLARADWPQPSV